MENLSLIEQFTWHCWIMYFITLLFTKFSCSLCSYIVTVFLRSSRRTHTHTPCQNAKEKQLAALGDFGRKAKGSSVSILYSYNIAELKYHGNRPKNSYHLITFLALLFYFSVFLNSNTLTWRC